MVQAALGKLALTPVALLGWVYALAPGFARVGMASVVAWFPRLFKYREKIARQNLLYAFPGDGPVETAKREKILRLSYLHLGHLFFEICMVLGPFSAMRFFIRRNVRFIGREYWEKALAEGHGLILAGNHIGSWEVMVAAGNTSGINCLLVTKKLKPAWLHDWIEKGRLRCGVKSAYEPKTLSMIITQLKEGKTVGLVLDQYAGAPIGVRVPLFGIPVGTASVAAALARRFDAPVLPIVNYRTSGGKFVVDIRPPVPFDGASDSRGLGVNTARYVAVVEQDIKAHPDQWLWIHRRFKGDLGPLRPEEWDRPRARR